MVWPASALAKRHPPMTDEDYFARYLKRTIVTESGCWLYQGTTNYKGYAQVFVRGKRHMIHRWAYSTKHGPIPKGMQACHKCDQRTCYNPDHIFAGTNQDNCKDMAAKGRHQNNRKTHCVRGHEYTPENTIHFLDVRGWNHRRCRECERGRWQRERAKVAPSQQEDAHTLGKNRP